MNYVRINVISFPIKVVILTLCLILGLFSQIGMALTTLISLVMFFTSGTDERVYIMFFLFPFATIIKLDVTSISLFYIILFGAVMSTFIVQKPNIIRSVGGLFLLLSGYIFVLGFLGDFIESITLSLSFAYVILLMLDVEEIDYIKLIRTVAISEIIGSVMALFQDFFPRLNIEYAGFEDSESEYSRFGGLLTNPNNYTVLINILIACFLLLYIKGLTKKIDIVLLITLIVFGFMSLSKSFIVCLVITAFFVVAVLFRNEPKKFIIFIIIAFIAGLIMFGTSLRQYIDVFSYRFSADIEDDATLSSMTTGRTDYWQMYFDYFIHNPIKFVFGKGLGGGTLNGHAAHNTYIETIYYIGLIGLFLVASFWIIVIKCVKKNYGLVFYIPLLAMLVRCAARTLLLEPQFVFLFMLCVFAFSSNMDGYNIAIIPRKDAKCIE